MKRRILWILFLTLLFISSYYREVFFRSINAIIQGEDFFYAKTTSLPFLQSWSKAELIRLKYILTISFSFLFIGLTVFGLKLSFKERSAYLFSMGAYSLLIVVALFAGIIGVISIGFSETYPLLRMMVGWIHNPLLYLLVSAGVLAYDVVKRQDEF